MKTIKIAFTVTFCLLFAGCSSDVFNFKLSTAEDYDYCIKNTPTKNCEYLK